LPFLSLDLVPDLSIPARSVYKGIGIDPGNNETTPMMGLIHRILFNMVAAHGGTEAVAQVKEQAGIAPDAVFRMNEPYADDEWRRLFSAACNVLDCSPSKAERLFGEAFLADSLRRFPKWFEMCKTARELLELQPVIHNGFATGLRSPADRKRVVEKFRLEKHDDRIVTHYRSPNRLSGLYVALAECVLKHYGELGQVSMLKSLERGDDESVIEVRFLGNKAPQP
jgi:hypothetical protein